MPEPIFMVGGSKCVDWCKEVPFVCLHYVRPFWGVVSPKNYPKKPQILKSQPNEKSCITSKRFKIDTKCQCNMNIKSGRPFRIRAEKSLTAPPSGEDTMTSFPANGKT